ncbi:MAG: PDZ domain-containing protein [Thermoleophilia bacterium]|nr:PDZ domain-containing protein [Thermoleophilia bacterium]
MKSIPLWVKLLGGIGVLAAICVGLAFVPTGQVAFAPNAPIDLDGKITVGGNPAEPLQGRMYLVGVTERKVNLLQRMLLDVSDPSVDFGPAPANTPASGGPAASDVRAMDEAKQVAAGVAFDIVGRSTDWSGTGVKVEAVAPDGPAGRVLRPGDLIVRVNGTNVDSSVDASRIINQLPPGSTVRLGMQRAGVAVQSTLKTVAPREDGTGRRSEIGVELSTIGLRVRLPENVGIDSGNVVGPSAGLAFALYLIDSMSDDDLLRGRYVVATGSVSPDGLVLPVGRVKQKAVATQNAKRDLLLVPVANAKEARAAVADACSGNACVQVVPVHSVSEAVDLLKLDDAALAAKVGG